LTVVSAIKRNLCAFVQDDFPRRRKRKMDKVELTMEIPESLKYGAFAGKMRLLNM